MKRSQRATVIAGKPVFILNARLELSAQDTELVRKYRLGNQVVYDSKARQANAAAAQAHFSAADLLSLVNPASMMWKTAKGAFRAVTAAFALRVTIDSLVKGEHIECKDLDELLGAEQAIKEACEAVRTYLDVALSFDGREVLLEI